MDSKPTGPVIVLLSCMKKSEQMITNRDEK